MTDTKIGLLEWAGPAPSQEKETMLCSYCGGKMEKCGNGWYCRNPECGFNFVSVKNPR